jgi:phage gp36-like protein
MPVPWISLTLADLNVGKVAALVTQLRTAALAENQPDPVPEVVTNATNRIRQEIAAGGKTVLDADATKIPPSLKSLAVRMVLREAQSRLNALGGLPLSEDERQEEKNDLRYLERIANGNPTVEASTNPEATPSVQAAVASPRISAPERTFTRDHQDGI